MISSSHITAGAALGLAVGSAIPNPALSIPLAVLAGIISHHILDSVVHTDPGSFRAPDDKGATKPHELKFAIPDNVISTAVVLYVFFTHQPSWPMLFGAIGGNFPDVLHNVGTWADYTRHKFAPWYFWLHETFHWTARGREIPYGVLTNIIVIVLSLLYLFG